MRRLLVALLAIGVVSTASYAVTTDAFTITITPQLNFSVMIDTDSVNPIGLDMTAPGMIFISTGSFSAPTDIATATVYNDGNTRADWEVSGSIVNAAAEKAWDFSSDDRTTTALDSVAVCAILADVATSASSITDGSFTNADLVDISWQPMNGTDFYYDASGNDVDATNARQLYYLIKTPSDTSSTAIERISIIIRARPSGTF